MADVVWGICFSYSLDSDQPNDRRIGQLVPVMRTYAKENFI